MKFVKTVSEIRNYVVQGLNGFIKDNPDTDYQRGYLSALKDVSDFARGK